MIDTLKINQTAPDLNDLPIQLFWFEMRVPCFSPLMVSRGVDKVCAITNSTQGVLGTNQPLREASRK